MPIYTRQGDKGKTSLPGIKHRVEKHHPLIEIYGIFDELVTTLNIINTHKTVPKSIKQLLTSAQKDIFSAGTQLFSRRTHINVQTIQKLEQQMDYLEAGMPKLNQFIISSKTASSAYCHLARCICRRLERRLIAFHRKKPIHRSILAYMNRLSDWLFILARKLDNG